MSTKQTTNSSNTLNYDPAALSTYKDLIGTASNSLTDFIKNPLQSTFFNNLFGMANKQALQMGSARNKNVFGNLAASGMSGKALPGYTASMLAAGARGTSGQQAGSFNSLLGNATQARLAATGQGMAFQPLMTGSQGTQTTTTGGLGSWLPQLAGAAIGAGVGAMTGGASTAAGAAMSLRPSAAMSMPKFNFGLPSSIGGMSMNSLAGMVPMPTYSGAYGK